MHVQVCAIFNFLIFFFPCVYLLRPPIDSQSTVASDMTLSVCSHVSLKASVWASARQTHYITTTVTPDTRTQGDLSQAAADDTSLTEHVACECV